MKISFYCIFFKIVRCILSTAHRVFFSTQPKYFLKRFQIIIGGRRTTWVSFLRSSAIVGFFFSSATYRCEIDQMFLSWPAISMYERVNKGEKREKGGNSVERIRKDIKSKIWRDISWEVIEEIVFHKCVSGWGHLPLFNGKAAVSSSSITSSFLNFLSISISLSPLVSCIARAGLNFWAEVVYIYMHRFFYLFHRGFHGLFIFGLYEWVLYSLFTLYALVSELSKLDFVHWGISQKRTHILLTFYITAFHYLYL